MLLHQKFGMNNKATSLAKKNDGRATSRVGGAEGRRDEDRGLAAARARPNQTTGVIMGCLTSGQPAGFISALRRLGC